MLFSKFSPKYKKSSKSDKSKIIDNLISSTGLHRKSVIRQLNSSKINSNSRGGSKSKYPPASLKLIESVWRLRDCVCAELLHPFVSETLDSMQKSGLLLRIDHSIVDIVRNIPLGTLKLKIADFSRSNDFKYSHRSKKNSLKQFVVVNTSMNKSSNAGSLELDFVDHCGSSQKGQFARTLCCVDVFTQFISRCAVIGKSKETTQLSFQKSLDRIPFHIHKLHTDNEPSLINSLLFQQAKSNQISISRSRPYHKQDNGHVEQKNGDKIRNLVGYRRYDSNIHLALLNELYEIDDLYQNHFIASRKLIEKVYADNGKLINKSYDQPKTPHQRVLDDLSVDEITKSTLIKLHESLNLVELKGKRDKILTKLRSCR